MSKPNQAEHPPVPTAAPPAAPPSDDLLSALSGLDANRTRTVANRTRRVVLSSQGVLQEQNRGRNRARSFAIAGAIVLLLLLAPLAWQASEGFTQGEHLLDPSAQLAIWAVIACAAILAAALVAGWLRRRDHE
jgi:hypothetical protein